MTTPHIVSTPDTCFGAPRIDGTRVPVHAVVDRFVAGDTVWGVAIDFGVHGFQIEEALRFALMTRRQREKYLAGMDPFRRSDAKARR